MPYPLFSFLCFLLQEDLVPFYRYYMQLPSFYELYSLSGLPCFWCVSNRTTQMRIVRWKQWNIMLI